jgi:tetratricopeptide (TPR) repeat protein
MPLFCRSGLLALVVLVAPALVRAAPWDESLKPEARAEFLRAVKLYNAQMYAQAAEAFRSAYLIDPAPKLLFSIAQAQRVGGDCAQATESYRAFLRTNPEASAAALARDNMALCQPVETPTPVPPTPTPPSAETDVTQALAAPMPPPARRDVVSGVLLGTAGASLVGATIFAIMEHNSINARNVSNTYDAFSRNNAHADTQRALAIALGGVALGCAGAAVRRLFYD